jgi:hypothetical protein
VTQFISRYGRVAIGVAICAVLLGIAAFYGDFSHKVKSADTLAGKWVGKVVWNDASGRPYRETMRTALFFLPGGVVGTVITFPTGAIGGAGRYTLKDSHLTVHCTSLSVNGRPMPMTTFSHSPWFHDTAAYTVAYDGANLTLTPAAEPTPAPCWPLLVSPKPLVLSRIAPPEEATTLSKPRE